MIELGTEKDTLKLKEPANGPNSMSSRNNPGARNNYQN